MAVRYAIYYTPSPQSPLAEAGRAWIGVCRNGNCIQSRRPDVPEIGPSRLDDVTRAPRKYGFHATLKAPFRLAEGKDEKMLMESVATFAENIKRFKLPGLSVETISNFLALVPTSPSTDLNALAAQCVETFDPFRAPMAQEERAKRCPSRLSPEQIALMDRWGYPYVFEEYRFHMTLTGKIQKFELSILKPVLKEHFSSALSKPGTVSELTVMKQMNSCSVFEELKRFKLA